MSKDPLLESNFAPEALYANFEGFLDGHQGMMQRCGLSYVWVHMLLRLASDDLEKGRRVFNWAVKRTCISMLADEQFPPLAQKISSGGQHWVDRAEKTFGVNPAKSISMIEGVYLLERLAVWAEIYLQNKFEGSTTLLEFRKRPENNEEVSGNIGWLDLFYQQARGKATDETEQFVRRRDCAIALALTALAGRRPPTDREIDEVMMGSLPTHRSRAKQAALHGLVPVPGSLVRQEFVMDWVLGPHQKEIGF